MSFADGETERDARAGDASRAGAAVGLKDVAVHPRGAGPEFFEIEHGAEGAADQALDFLGASVELELRDVARLPVQSGVGEHRILGRDPSAGDLLILHPAGNGFLDGHAADHAGVAPFDQGRAGGVRGDVVLETDRTQLPRLTAIGAGRGKFRNS
jgi:hypothetical protein